MNSNHINGEVPDAASTGGAVSDAAADSKAMRNGTLAGILCYVMWGFFPLYWKLLSEVDPYEIIAHRIIWCFAFTFITCLVARLNFVTLLKDKRALSILAPAAVIITINWGIYIYAVSVDHIVETAIGYYVNPLVSILFGVLMFKERLTKTQITAFVLCAAGIVFFTVDYGSFPWFALILALSFGTYGAVKKKGGYPAIQALAVENTVMVIPAIVFAVVLANVTGTHAFLGDTATLHGWQLTILLIVGGVVTAIPLILFAKAANSIPLSILGFIQYLSPTIALMMGVFVNGEAFTLAHAVCLGCIWLGLALVSGEQLLSARKNR